MSIEREDARGVIKVNDNIFASIIMRAANRCSGKVFLVSEAGKVLGGLSKKVSIGELAANISTSTEGDTYAVDFFVMLNFGESIAKVSDEMLDCIIGEMKMLFPESKFRIGFNLLGVKSRNVAERNERIVREYEPK